MLVWYEEREILFYHILKCKPIQPPRKLMWSFLQKSEIFYHIIPLNYHQTISYVIQLNHYQVPKWMVLLNFEPVNYNNEWPGTYDHYTFSSACIVQCCWLTWVFCIAKWIVRFFFPISVKNFLKILMKIVLKLQISVNSWECLNSFLILFK